MSNLHWGFFRYIPIYVIMEELIFVGENVDSASFLYVQFLTSNPKRCPVSGWNCHTPLHMRQIAKMHHNGFPDRE